MIGNSPEGEVQCTKCGEMIPTTPDSGNGSIQQKVVESTSQMFANGLGALGATSRLATIARRENILVAVAVAIAIDYFSILSHVQSLSAVC